MTQEKLAKANELNKEIIEAKEKIAKCNRLITACGLGLVIVGTPRMSNVKISIDLNNTEISKQLLNDEIALLNAYISKLEKQLEKL
jgi:hypothetical protein